MTGDEGLPAPITEAGRELRRLDDVGEQHGREDAVGRRGAPHTRAVLLIFGPLDHSCEVARCFGRSHLRPRHVRGDVKSVDVLDELLGIVGDVVGVEEVLDEVTVLGI